MDLFRGNKKLEEPVQSVFCFSLSFFKAKGELNLKPKHIQVYLNQVMSVVFDVDL